MTITLVRHAEVIEEYIGKYNGHIDIPLSENGKLQAKKLAEKLKDRKFDKIYCSDLLRARQTLEFFKLKQKIIYTDQLREKSWGKDEGKSYDEIVADGREYINFEQWINVLDGENMLNYRDKIERYFNNIIFKNKKNNILIVTHSGVIKTLLSIVNKTTLEDSFKISLPYATSIDIVKNLTK